MCKLIGNLYRFVESVLTGEATFRVVESVLTCGAAVQYETCSTRE